MAAWITFYNAVEKLMSEGRKTKALRVAQSNVIASDIPSNYNYPETPREQDRHAHPSPSRPNGRPTTSRRESSVDSTRPWEYKRFSNDGRPTHQMPHIRSFSQFHMGIRQQDRRAPYAQSERRHDVSDKRIRHHDPRRAPPTLDRPRPSQPKERRVEYGVPKPTLKSVIQVPKPTLKSVIKEPRPTTTSGCIGRDIREIIRLSLASLAIRRAEEPKEHPPL